MSGKLFGGALLVLSIVAGIAMYYLQVYAYYDEVQANGTDDVVMTVLASGQAEPILYEDYQAIDSDSSRSATAPVSPPR